MNVMKKINLFLAMLLVAMAQILFISCDGNNPEPEEPTTAELILGTWNADQMLFTAGIGNFDFNTFRWVARLGLEPW